jgi:hypothetical protein
MDPAAAKVGILPMRLPTTADSERKAVVLAHRPPISIPQTTVAPALLVELLGEIGTLASVYHKPAETFIGKGRVGADAMKRGGECVVLLGFVTWN